MGIALFRCFQMYWNSYRCPKNNTNIRAMTPRVLAACVKKAVRPSLTFPRTNATVAKRAEAKATATIVRPSRAAHIHSPR